MQEAGQISAFQVKQEKPTRKLVESGTKPTATPQGHDDNLEQKLHGVKNCKQQFIEFVRNYAETDDLVSQLLPSLYSDYKECIDALRQQLN